MNYIAKGGKCLKCGVSLPVPAWKWCLLHDPVRASISKVPFVELKPISNIVSTEREYRKKLTKIILSKKKRPLIIYMGYEVKIPFDKFLNAKELVTEEQTWTIIGWR